MNGSNQGVQVPLKPDVIHSWRDDGDFQHGAPAGMILVGIMLGAAAGAGALLLGTSIWLSLLIYAATGAVSVLVLAVSVVLRSDPGVPSNRLEMVPENRTVG